MTKGGANILGGIVSSLFLKAYQAQQKYQNQKAKAQALLLEQKRKKFMETTSKPNIKDSQIMQILFMVKQGLSGASIARELGLSPSVVYNSTRRYTLVENPETGGYWFERTHKI